MWESTTVHLKEELEVFLSLDHPHVARLEDVYETADGEIHIVMEHLEGGEVHDRLLQKKSFTESEGAEAIRQMLMGVCYLHSRQIIHRDLKCENFMYEDADSDQLKMIDFGFAVRSNVKSESKTYVCGSRAYLAPEGFECQYTDKIDVWSMGIIAYTLLCGVLPWSGTNNDAMKDIRAGTPYFNPKFFDCLSNDAQNFVRALLVADASERPTASVALGHLWLQRPSSVTETPGRDLGRLAAFSRAPPLRRLVHLLAAWALPRSAEAGPRELFLSIAGECGVIRPQQLRDALAEHKTTAEEADEIFAGLDSNKNGEVSYREFLAAVMEPKLDKETMQLAFHRFDADGDGKISSRDARALVGKAAYGASPAELLAKVASKVKGEVKLTELETHLRRTRVGQAQRNTKHQGAACFAWCR